MTIFMCDGFEAYGNKSTPGASVQASIAATNRQLYDQVSGGHGGDVSLIDDFEVVGYALEFPQLDGSRAEWVNYEYPDGTTRNPDYKVTTNSSSPIMCVGFRFFNAADTPTGTVQIFQALTAAATGQGSVSRLSDGTSLRYTDVSSNTFDGLDCLTPDTWHYIEIEWKLTNAASGGYVKVYVEGNEVISTGATNTASFTFFTSWGFRIGVAASVNQTGGSNFAIDDVYGMEIDGVDHTAPLGACRVLAMRPSGDAGPNAWTPSTGSDNFEMVNEDGQDTSDYVTSTGSGDRDNYSLTPLEGVSAVHGVRIDTSCIAISSATTLFIGLDDGTLDEDSVGSIGTSSATNRQEFHALDPSGSPWTEASVEAVEATQRQA